jgi:hypothetical protein
MRLRACVPPVHSHTLAIGSHLWGNSQETIQTTKIEQINKLIILLQLAYRSRASLSTAAASAKKECFLYIIIKVIVETYHVQTQI